MKNYVVKALIYFKDKDEKKKRKVGEEFETTKERYEFLRSKDAVELVKVIEEEKKENKEEQFFTKEETDELVDEIITKKKRKSSKK